MVYQPHRYSRTSELFDQFVDVLKLVDLLLLTEVYPAGESPIAGATGEDLYRQLKLEMGDRVHWLEQIERVNEHLPRILLDDDVVLTQGAGETAALAAGLFKQWQDASEEPQGAPKMRSLT